MRQKVLVLALLLCAGDAFAKANGVDSRATFPPLGCGSVATGEQAGCHVQDASPALLVTIDGPAQLDLGPAASGFYTISIPAGFGGLMGAGANVAIAAPNSTGCQLEKFSSNLGFENESLDPNDPVLSHAYAGDPPPTTLVGVWSYQFLVLGCQAPGRLLLLAAMNAFDGSGDETGEVWNKTELGVDVPEPDGSGLGLAGLLALRALQFSARRRRRRPL